MIFNLNRMNNALRGDKLALLLGEKGAAIVETAIILPTWALVMMFLFEIGQGITDHILMSHIAGVGARFAEGLSFLEPTDGLAGRPSYYSSVFPIPAAGTPAKHRDIQNRVFRLIMIHELYRRFSGPITVKTIYTPGTWASATPDKDSIRIEIRGEGHSAIFGVLGINWGLGANSEGGYLY